MKNYRILIVYKFQNKYNITFFKTIIFFKMRAPFQSKQRGYFFLGVGLNNREDTHFTKALHIWPFCIGSGLGPMHMSTGLVEILTRVQKLDKTEHVSRSQRVQCSCALDPSLSLLYPVCHTFFYIF